MSQKAEKKYGKQNDTSQIDLTTTSRTHDSRGSSDEESGDDESEDERDLENTSKLQDDTAEQDDLLVLKKRHVNFDSGPPLIEVSFKAQSTFKSEILVECELQPDHILTMTFFYLGRPGSKREKAKETEDQNCCGQKNTEQKCED